MNTEITRHVAIPTIDLIWGAENIAREMGITTRQCFHMLSKKAVPARKVGGRWVVERRKLRAFFTEEDAQ